MLCRALGFGATAKGGAAFAASGGPAFDLSRSYVGSVMAWAPELGAAVSALRFGLASSAGCSRLIYAMSRIVRTTSSLATVTRHAGAEHRSRRHDDLHDQSP
jgi:amino acid transporter